MVRILRDGASTVSHRRMPRWGGSREVIGRSSSPHTPRKIRCRFQECKHTSLIFLVGESSEVHAALIDMDEDVGRLWGGLGARCSCLPLPLLSTPRSATPRCLAHFLSFCETPRIRSPGLSRLWLSSRRRPLGQ